MNALIGADRDIYIARVVVRRGDVARDVMPTCVEDLKQYSIAAIVACYADRRGERIINRWPLEVNGNIITDAKGRQWRAIGITYGDPTDPSFMPWGSGVADALKLGR